MLETVDKKEIVEFGEQSALDYDIGYHDSLSGCYNKWYKQNRTDCGAAYHEGWIQGHRLLNPPKSLMP